MRDSQSPGGRVTIRRRALPWVLSAREPSEEALAYILIAPTILVLVLVVALPLISAVKSSFQTGVLAGLFKGEPAKYVGLANYFRVITAPGFLSSLQTSLIFAAGVIALDMLIGLGTALLLYSRPRAGQVFRTLLLVPMLMANLTAGLMWFWLFNDQAGLINHWLFTAGVISHYINWLGESSSALWAVIIADAWRNSPFVMLLLLAGLQSVPGELHSVAAVCGATNWKIFWHVTLPLIKPMLLVALLIRTMDAFRTFEMIYAMTQGGPGNATKILSVYTYETTFRYFRLEEGAALGLLIFLLVLGINLCYIYALAKRGQKIRL